LPCHPFLLLFLSHKKEGDGSLLPSPSLFEGKDNSALSLSFSSLTQKEGNGNKLSLPSSLEHHQRRRRWQQALVISLLNFSKRFLKKAIII
jgi:hypothetical protein